MANKIRKKRRAKPKSKSPRNKTTETSSAESLDATEDTSTVDLRQEKTSLSQGKGITKEEPQTDESQPQSPSTATPTETTEALVSISAQNLYQLSLTCFAISLILFVSTYNMIANNGGTTTLFGSTSIVVSTVPPECPVVEVPSPTIAEIEHKELLVGYKILHHTLKKESQLKYLHWLRDATFRGPKGSLKSTLTTVYQTSQMRFRELEHLFIDESPTIRLKDAPKSAMGDSIQDEVEKTSAKELVPLPFSSSQIPSLPHLQWGVRFVLIQAQATRMVVGLATSLLKFETNPERKHWLKKLADEYEGMRETIVECILLTVGEDSWKE